MAKQKTLEEVVNYAKALPLEELLKLQKEIVATIAEHQKSFQTQLSNAKSKLDLIEKGGE